MTVVETKLTNLRNKLIGIKAVNKATVVYLEDVLGRPVITEKIDLNKFTDDESTLYYNEVLAAVDDELRSLHNIKVRTLKDIMDVYYKLVNVIADYKKYISKLSESYSDLDTVLNQEVLNSTIYISDYPNNDNHKLITVGDYNVLTLFKDRLDVANDILGESRVEKIISKVRTRMADDDNDNEYAIISALPFLLNLTNYVKVIKGEGSSINLNNDIFNYDMDFKVKDLDSFIKNIYSVYDALELTTKELHDAFKYERVSNTTSEVQDLYEKMLNILDSDGISKIILMYLAKD